MKHYHGTPMGGTRAGVTQFARRRFFFVPWKRPEDLDIVQAVAAGFAVDNSAFSFWRNGFEPDWEEYVIWVKNLSRHPKFDFAVIPDVIDGTEEDNVNLLDWWDGKCLGINAYPVWHLHESLSYLKNLVSRGGGLALGSSGEYSQPGSPKWKARMREAMSVICRKDGSPKVKIHGLRMLNPRIVESYPFASCDSTNVAQNGTAYAKTHGITNPVAGMELVAQRVESAQSPPCFVHKPSRPQGFGFL